MPLESDGVDIGAVEAACADGPVKLAHVIPNFHNPAGCTLSHREAPAAGRAGRRARLPPLRGRPLPADQLRGADAGETMLDMDDAGRVIHASSFSKTVSPGIRVGYLVGPADEIAALAKRGGPRTTSRRTCWPSPSSGSCASRARSRRTSKYVNAALRERRDALVAALEEKIPEAKFVAPGGRLLPLARPRGRRRHRSPLLDAAKEEGVTFVAGPDFMIDGGGSSLRLSFAPVPAERVPEGVDRLARALEKLRRTAAAQALSRVRRGPVATRSSPMMRACDPVGRGCQVDRPCGGTRLRVLGGRSMGAHVRLGFAERAQPGARATVRGSPGGRAVTAEQRARLPAAFRDARLGQTI